MCSGHTFIKGTVTCLRKGSPKGEEDPWRRRSRAALLLGSIARLLGTKATTGNATQGGRLPEWGEGWPGEAHSNSPQGEVCSGGRVQLVSVYSVSRVCFLTLVLLSLFRSFAEDLEK